MINKENKRIYFTISILVIISILNLYNAKYLNTYYENYYIKQTIWYIVGVIILIFFKKKNLQWTIKYSGYIYLSNILLLVLVLLIGKEINGTRAWLNFGFFALQPSEFMKLSLTLFLIKVSQNKENKVLNIIKTTFYTIIPSILVFLEPDTGAIIFFLIIWLYFISTKKIKWYYYLFLILLGMSFICTFIYLYISNQDILIKYMGTSFFYRVDRFINFRSNNYQLELSLLSIFGTQIIRNGFNNILIYIPEGATDFIFAFSVGNYGLIMGLLIIICYIVLLWQLINKSQKNSNKKTNYLIISFSLILFFQILINILMNIGLIPIVGITLPFLSYGGSSIIVTFLFLTLIINFSNTDNYSRKVYSKNKNNSLAVNTD